MYLCDHGPVKEFETQNKSIHCEQETRNIKAIIGEKGRATKRQI